jgi:hypothetical protein
MDKSGRPALSQALQQLIIIQDVLPVDRIESGHSVFLVAQRSNKFLPEKALSSYDSRSRSEPLKR